MIEKDKLKFSEDMPLGRFYNENKDLFGHLFRHLAKDVVPIKARNPENPEDTILFYLTKKELEEMDTEGKKYTIPLEEFVFLGIMLRIQKSDIPGIMKEKIRLFTERQMRKIHKPMVDLLDETLECIPIAILKKIIVNEQEISINDLDKLEMIWRREYMTKKLSENYKDEEIYVKMKLLAMQKK
jgi:hypothetical protein